MPNTLTAIPATITAGDSYSITLSLTEYPASAGWGVSLVLAGPSVATWNSAPFGDAHRITVTTAQTTGLAPGLYQYALRAIRSGAVETVERASLTVTADLSALVGGEGTSYWATLKKAAEAALLNLMDGGAVQMVMILGRQTMFRSPDDCLRVIAYCDTKMAPAVSGRVSGSIQTVFVRR